MHLQRLIAITFILLLTLGLGSPSWVGGFSYGPVQHLPKFNVPHPEPLKMKSLQKEYKGIKEKVLPAKVVPRHLWRTFRNSV